MNTQGAKWAVYHRKSFWLTDTCAGGSWSSTVEEAEWFDTETAAAEALAAAEIEIDPHDIVILRVR
jgi:hypothetical protein